MTKTYMVTIKKNLEGIYYGDVDGSGGVDINDATLILRKSLSLPTSDDMDWLAADVDDDGAITINDATMVLRHSLSLPLSAGYFNWKTIITRYLKWGGVFPPHFFTIFQKSNSFMQYL